MAWGLLASSCTISHPFIQPIHPGPTLPERVRQAVRMSTDHTVKRLTVNEGGPAIQGEFAGNGVRGAAGGAPIRLREAAGRGGAKKNLGRAVRGGGGRLLQAGGNIHAGPETGTQRGRLARPRVWGRAGRRSRRKGKQRAGPPGRQQAASRGSAKGPHAFAKGWREDTREI